MRSSVAPTFGGPSFFVLEGASQFVRRLNDGGIIQPGASFSTTVKESAGRAAVKARNHAARSASRRSALRAGHGPALALVAFVGRLPPALELVGDCPPTVAMGRRSCDATLPLSSTGTGRGGKSVSGGDTATDNEIMAPAAKNTQPDASSCFACIAGTVCAIRGIGMTDVLAPARVSGKTVPPTQWPLQAAMSALPPKADIERVIRNVC